MSCNRIMDCTNPYGYGSRPGHPVTLEPFHTNDLTSDFSKGRYGIYYLCSDQYYDDLFGSVIETLPLHREVAVSIPALHYVNKHFTCEGGENRKNCVVESECTGLCLFYVGKCEIKKKAYTTVHQMTSRYLCPVLLSLGPDGCEACFVIVLYIATCSSRSP